MYKEANRPAWAEINLTNAAFNIQNIRAKIGPAVEIIGIIKADGYGHGAIPMAKVLKENGVKSFGVATLNEAIALRNEGIKDEIVILGLTPNMYIDILLKYNLTPVTSSYDNASAISAAALKEGMVINGYIAVDSGMGRIGYLPYNPDSIEDIIKTNNLAGFKIKGLFSHFSTADSADKSYAHLQEETYLKFVQKLRDSNVNVSCKTLANSAAIMELPSSHYDVVRPGIILYGCYPSGETDKGQINLKPVMSIKANIVFLKKVDAGFSVSYGRKFISKRESLIATINIGYADGYPRPYSEFGKVIVRGKMAPLAGNICMDQCMIDVTDVPGVEVGDEVILMGTDGINTILADDIADATGTINYEIVCAFGQRLPKVYVK
jgi:alanine racemase